jgi:hypothetical protein
MRRLLLLVMAVLALAAAKPEPLTMKFTPSKSFASAHPTIRITLHIERSIDNRAMAWACDGDGGGNYYSRSWSIDGDSGPITFEDQITMRGVAAGHYQCVAELTRVTDKLRAGGSFDVLGDDPQ